MPDPIEPVNQSGTPIDPTIKTDWTKIANKITDSGSVASGSYGDSPVSSSGSVLSSYEQNVEIQQMVKAAEQEQRNTDVDNWWETLSSGTANLLSATVAGFSNIIGSAPEMLDFGIALATGNAATHILTGGASSETTNINPIRALYEGVDLLLDVEDGDRKNVFSRTAEEIDAYRQTYFQTRNSDEWNAIDGGWTEYIVNQGSSVVGGIVPFIVQGIASGGVLSALKVPQLAAKVATAHFLTSTAGYLAANETYDKVYDEVMNDLSPEFKSYKQTAFQEAYDNAIESGANSQDAAWAARKAEKAAIKQFGLDNPDVDKIAKANAKKGAAITAGVNYVPIMALNLATAGLFTRGHYLSQELLKSGSKWSGKEILSEMGQEVVEETLIEGLGGDIGYQYGVGNKSSIIPFTDKGYGFTDAFNNFFGYEEINGEQKWKGWQTFETAFWAAAGSAGTTGYMQSRDGGPQERWGGKTKAERYVEQQEMIKKWDSIGNVGNNMGLIESLTTLNKSNKEVLELQKHQEKLVKAGKKEEAKAVGDKILSVQAMIAFKSGTTESLITNYEKIANDTKVDKEIRERAKEGVAMIKDLEKVFQESMIKYGNSSEVYNNRANNYTLNKLNETIDTEIREQKGKAETAITSALRNNDLSLRGEIDIYESSDGSTDGVVGFSNVPTGKVGVEVGYNIDNLLENTYANAIDPHESQKAGIQEKFSKDAMKIKDARELVELQEKKKEITKIIDENNKQFNKITDPAYQRSLKAQNKLLTDVEKDSGLEDLKGTDAYMEAIDKKLAKYKGKILDEQASSIREQFEVLNNIEKAVLAKKNDDKIKEALKKEEEEKKKLPPIDKKMLANVAVKFAKNEPLSDAEKEFVQKYPDEVKKAVDILKKNGKLDDEAEIDEDEERKKLAAELAALHEALGDVPTDNELNKLFSNFPPAIRAKVLSIVNSIKSAKGEIAVAPIIRVLGKANAELLLQSLVADGKLSFENDKYTRVSNTPVFSETLLKIMNSTKFIDAGGKKILILPLDSSKLDPDLLDKLKAAVEELREAIKNGLAPNFKVSVDSRDPNRVVIEKIVAESFSPAEEDFDRESFSPYEEKELSKEAKEKAAGIVMDYVNSMMGEGGEVPSFEQFLRDFIFHNSGSVAGAQKAFNLLKEGWRANKDLPQIPLSHYEAIYNKLFAKSKASLADELLGLLEEEVKHTDEKAAEKVLEETAEQLEPEKKLELNDDGRVINLPKSTTSTVTVELENVDSTFGYASREAIPTTTVFEEDGETLVDIGYEYGEEGLNEGNLTKPLKLLHPDQYNPGTVLEVVILEGAELDKLQVPVREEDPLNPAYGTVLKDEKGKRKTETYKSYLKRKLDENPNFMSTQEYEDNLPMLIKDEDGDYVAFVHDVMWYQDKFEGQRAEAIAKVRKIRRAALNAKANGKPFNIVITKKESGTFSPMKLDKEKSISEASPQSQIGVMDKHGKIMFNGKPFEGKIVNKETIEKKKLFYQPLDIRRWGTDENGEPTYMVFPTFSRKLTSTQSETLFQSVITYLVGKQYYKHKNNKYTPYLIAKKHFATAFGEIDQIKILDGILSQNVIVKSEKINTTGNIQEDAQKVHNIKLKSWETSGTKLLPYIYTESRNVVFWFPGMDAPVILDAETFMDNAETDEKVKLLKEFFNHPDLLFNPTFKSALPVIKAYENQNGEIVFEQSSDTYEEYVKDHLETNIGSYNVGTQEEPMYVTRMQPVYTYAPTDEAPVSRKTTNEVVKKAAPIVKQKATYITDVLTDEELDAALGTIEDYNFIGETAEEKLEDAKQAIAENTNQSKEIVSHLEPNDDKVSEGDANEINHLIKVAENQIKWVNEYFSDEIPDVDRESFSPAEMADEDAKELLKQIFKIEGLSQVHQAQLIDFLFNQLSDNFKLDNSTKLNKGELAVNAKKELMSLMSDNKKNLTDTLASLKLVPNYENDAKIKELVLKYEVALDKFKIVEKNLDTIVDEAFNKLYKFAGIKAKTTKNEQGEEEITIEAKDLMNENPDKEESEELDEYGEDEAMSEREDNYSQTSLEKNGKNSITSELRLFLAKITNINSKTGLPVLGAFGVTTFVDFDTVFNTIQAFLADQPVDFDIQMKILEDLYIDTHPWLKEAIVKLRAADKQIQNSFANKMGTHSLKMEFAMYSFDLNTGKYTLRVTDTNQSAIVKKIASTWNNNLFAVSNPLITEEDGEYIVDTGVANNLLEEYDSWFAGPKDLANVDNKPLVEIVKSKLGVGKSGTVTLNPNNPAHSKFLAQIGNKLDTTKKMTMNGSPYSVTLNKNEKGESVLTIVPFQEHVVGRAVKGYMKLTKEERAEAVSEVQIWLSYFGIELADAAIEQIFTNKIFSDGELLTATGFFMKSDNTKGAIGKLAAWCQGVKNGNVETDLTSETNLTGNPLDDGAIRSTLAYLQSKYSKNIVTNSFRDGKKSIYGFTALKYVTDRFNELKDASSKSPQERKKITDDILTQLQSLSFSKQSLWLSLMDPNGDFGLGSKFGISHLGLTAITEKGKKSYKDNDITTLSDTDHEATKITMFQDMKQGSTTKTYSTGKKLLAIPLRVSRFFFPTMSDKSTMVVVKAPAFDLTNSNFYNVDGEGNVGVHEDILELLYEQIALPEITRMFAYKEKNKKTNIKSYDNGAGMLFFLPKLNDLEITLTNGKKVNLREFINNSSTTLKDLDAYKSQILPAIQSFVQSSVNEKLDNWKEGGILNEFGELDFVEKEYLEKIKKAKDKDSKISNTLIAAFDFEINQIIANANMFMTVIGDPAVYYKANPNDPAMTQVKETFVNVGKRLAAMIAPGSKINKSENEQYIQIFLDDRYKIADNIEFLTKLLDNKAFDREEYNKIMAMPVKGKDELETQKLKAAKASAIKFFNAKYPKSNNYFYMEATNAQEYTTWQEHLHILENMGRVADAAINITPQEIAVAKKLFADGTPLEDMTEAQRAVVKKVLQPIKPVYTGQIYDAEQDVMRMMYIKTSSYPLIPQLTKGMELDVIRETLEAVEKKTGKHVRASYESGNKVGANNNALKVFNPDGTAIEHKKPKEGKKDELEFDVDKILESSLTLNRKDFKIQLDVPFKSFKRKEDTVSMGTQLTKVLFGNGIMDIEGFKLNGQTYSGKQLQEQFTNLFADLVKLKQTQLCEELGVDPVTFKPTDVVATAVKVQKLLVQEAIDKGYGKQDIDALQISYIYDEDGKVTDFKFEMPIWMSANSNRFESLLVSIVQSRIVKMKFPGNSFVAGSEEGYKFKYNLDDVKENRIVWTDKWSGSLKPATFDDKGNFISAQVLVPAKFRDSEGNLINLMEKDPSGKGYKYVDETNLGFRLKKGKIAEELMSITSFRIPTSGHVSASQFEIVGFLPEESGDLMILPANMTEQKGLDFDVDKETAYNLWTTSLDSGTIIPLNKNSKNVSRLEEKLIQNELIKIHKSIFTSSNAEVQKKINGVLSIAFAKQQAQMIDDILEGEKDDTNFSPLNSEYQKGKMFLGASGKVGTGAYSLDVTSHSLFEQAKANGNQLILMADEETPLELTFGELTSHGKLGEPKTLKVSKVEFIIARLKALNTKEGDDAADLIKDNENFADDFIEGQASINPAFAKILEDYSSLQRPIAEVLMELQNIAVDNEKEQVMGKVNINGITLDISKVMALLGFDKGADGNSIQFLFLSQPIVRDYVKMMNNASSNLAEYDPDKEIKVLNALAKKYGFSLAKPVEGNGEALTNATMLGQLTNHSALFQQEVLQRFQLLQEYGLKLRSVQTSINIDSKGLGKSLPEVQEKLESIKSLFKNKSIKNAGALIGEIASPTTSRTPEMLTKEEFVNLGDNVWVKPTTISGHIAIAGLSFANGLWEKHFPYNSKVVAALNKEIFSILSLGEVSESKKIERKQLILKEIKKFMNTVAAESTLFENNTAQGERHRLFFDSREDNKVSLASYVQKLMKIPYFANNKLFQVMEYETSTVPGKPSLIKFNNAAAANFDESYMTNALLQLMESKISLPSFNGETYNTRMLAQDMINYAILEGGVQEVIQFAKFIPIDYLKRMGFSDALASLDLNGDAAAKFGITSEEVGSENYVPSRFAVQFAQNNTNILPKLDNLVNLDEEQKLKLIKKDKFTFADLKATAEVTPPFIVLRVNGENHLWGLHGTEYHKIIVAGINGMSEYDASARAVKSLITTRKKTKVKAPKTPLPVAGEATNMVSKERFGLGIDNISTVIKNMIADKSISPDLKKLAQAILPFVNNETKIVVSETIAKGKYNPGTNTITIPPRTAQADKNELIRVFLKETVHSITDNQLLKYLNPDGTLNNSLGEIPQHITDLLKIYKAARLGLEKKYGVDGINTVMEKIKKQKSIKTATEIEAAKKDENILLKQFEAKVLYGVTDILEFVEMMMTEPEFQTEMAAIDYGAGNKNLVDKFFDFIKQMFSDLGIAVGEGSITANAIKEIFNVMKDAKADVEAAEIDIDTTVWDTSKFSIFLNEDNEYEILADDGSLIDVAPTMEEAKIRFAEIVKSFEKTNEAKKNADIEEINFMVEAKDLVLNIDDMIINDYEEWSKLIKDVNLEDYNNYPFVQSYFKEAGAVAVPEEIDFINKNIDKFEAMLAKFDTKSPTELAEKLKDYTPPVILTQKKVDLSDDKDTDLNNEVEESGAFTAYELFPKVFANEEQSNALDSMNNFLKDKSAKTYVLTGGGGTGKTTIMKKLLSNNPGLKVVGGAIGHNAKEVLKKSIGSRATISTIASMIGLKLDDASGTFMIDKYFDVSKSPLSGAQLIIIDECSMIDEEFLAHLSKVQKLVAPNAKIIFMGDNAQLPPIREKYSKLEGQDSPTFTAYSGNYTAHLSKSMRQEKDSMILTVANMVAANVRSNAIVKDVLEGKEAKLHSDEVQFKDSDQIDAAIEADLKKDKWGTKVIAFSNVIRKYWNGKARVMLFGEQGAKRKFNVGEMISPQFTDEKLKNQFGEEIGVYNGQHFEVTKVNEVPNGIAIAYYDTKTNKESYSTYMAYDLTIKSADGMEFNIRVNDESLDFKAFQAAQKSLYNYYSKLPRGEADRVKKTMYEKNKTAFRSVEYGYALTSHKAQGSEFNNVYVFKNDILSNGTSTKSKNQALYVALSRAKKKLTVIKDVFNPDDYLDLETFSPATEKELSLSEEPWTLETNECGI